MIILKTLIYSNNLIVKILLNENVTVWFISNPNWFCKLNLLIQNVQHSRINCMVIFQNLLTYYLLMSSH